MIRRGLWRHLGSTVRALWLCDWMWMYLDWKMPQYCAGGWICSRVVCENTIVCVCVGGLKGHCTWLLLLLLILFSCRPSPCYCFPTEGGDLPLSLCVSGSSLIPLSPLPLCFLSSLLLRCFLHVSLGSIRHCSRRKSPLWWRGVCVLGGGALKPCDDQ